MHKSSTQQVNALKMKPEKLGVRQPTPVAQALKEALENLGIRVFHEAGDGHYHVDLLIQSARVCIEVDENQHLTYSRQILADLKRSHYSDREGYDTIHISKEARHLNFNQDFRRACESI